MSRATDEATRLLAALEEDTSRTAQIRVLSHALAEARAKPDWPAFWAALTDADCAEALRCAPRVAGEWETGDDHGEPYHMRLCAGDYEAAFYWPLDSGEWVWGIIGGISGRCATADLARTACDAALRAAGWRVIG